MAQVLQVPKDPIIKIQPYVNKKIIVYFTGGRKVLGVLKSFDNQLNMILDDTVEFLRNHDDLSITLDQTRSLGLIIVRGTQVTQILNEENYQEIENPFQQE